MEELASGQWTNKNRVCHRRCALVTRRITSRDVRAAEMNVGSSGKQS